MTKTILDTRDDMDALFAEIRNAVDIGPLEVSCRALSNHPSSKQSRSLHLYFKLLADSLATSGYNQSSILQKMHHGFVVPVSSTFLKDIFRAMCHVLTGKTSTSEVSSSEMSELYLMFSNRMFELTGVDVPWPSLQLGHKNLGQKSGDSR